MYYYFIFYYLASSYIYTITLKSNQKNHKVEKKITTSESTALIRDLQR